MTSNERAASVALHFRGPAHSDGARPAELISKKPGIAREKSHLGWLARSLAREVFVSLIVHTVSTHQPGDSARD